MKHSTLKVGDALPAVVTAPISRYTLAMFAGGSGDHNPIHLDTDLVKSFGMPDVFAQGMLSMAYLARVLTGFVAPERIRSYGVRFVAITPVKATVNCTATVAELFEEAGEKRARLALTTTIDGGVVTLQGDAVIALN